MIKLQAIGHLGKDAIVNTVNGKTVINFSIAHTEKFKDASGQPKEKTTWVECAYWTDRTAIAPYLKKGQQVYVDGTPEIRSYTKSDGTNGTSLALRVLTVQLLGGRTENGDGGGNSGNSYNTGNNNHYNSNSSQSNVPVTSPSNITEPLDDLPF